MLEIECKDCGCMYEVKIIKKPKIYFDKKNGLPMQHKPHPAYYCPWCGSYGEVFSAIITKNAITIPVSNKQKWKCDCHGIKLPPGMYNPGNNDAICPKTEKLCKKVKGD